MTELLGYALAGTGLVILFIELLVHPTISPNPEPAEPARAKRYGLYILE